MTVGNGVGEAAKVDMLLVAETEKFPCEYSVRPFGPPQISEELPLHVILQRPSVAMTLAAEREFPQ
jgi:hypothetical protein